VVKHFQVGETWKNGRLRQVHYAIGRKISWSRSRYAGGREIEGENIEKNDGRARRWSPFTGGRLAEVVARAGSTVFVIFLMYGILYYVY